MQVVDMALGLDPNIDLNQTWSISNGVGGGMGGGGGGYR